jgi:hypothetical protein
MKQTRFVIVVSSQQKVTSGSCYIAIDGYSTILKSKAARFQSVADAQAFAEASRIALTDHTYISLEDFIDLELTRQESFGNSSLEGRNSS